MRRAHLVALAVVVVSVASPPASAAAVRTLVASPTEIRGFAQDGQFVSWIARTPNGWAPICGRTFIRSLATGKQRAFGTWAKPVCGGEVALGRGRALWTGDPGICGNCVPARVSTAALSDPTIKHLGTFIYLNGGTQLTGLAADRQLLAFSWVRYDMLDEPDCLNEFVPCRFARIGGGLTRLVGRQKHSVPAMKPPALLAAGAGRLALAATADSWEGENPQPAANGPIEVIDPKTGALVMAVSPQGTALRLALAADALAVLIQRADNSLAIERYSIPEGGLLASTPVAASAARGELDVEGKWIVYRAGRQIRLIDASGGDLLLLRTRGRPIDVSIEGHRVAWAENAVTYHRIRAALAPR